ncbi:pantoate--beta-alanine ligase [Kitasatospora sp. DSM 101779]|uniref:pantoate--beta-alanine ligase n=1 Tax=Kitasatospora sp. DSM 101779 TaxID=2853165 RepID=UPI0021D934F8|nr:pantoate--beta-alanine ligase [Kitasatospora sp. DSM 101779]MCU7824109.1 pantoate--beta-alanine ligase [Kitasatospora sp. DSM 101779]
MARGKQPAKAPRTTALTRTVEEFEAAFWPDDQPVDNAVVMTMGALHAGHAALIRAARRQVGRDGRVAVTVFVNPLQFGAGEDLDRYPRTLDADLEVAREAGADVVFAPTVEEMYPNGEPLVRLSAGPMGDGFEGASRPGHFDGMLTVVAKLLHITDPDFAFFGEKDAQQLAIVRRMVADLDFDVEIVGVPTVREEDGLALSSRNRFLSDTERVQALALSEALFAGRDAGAQGAKAVREAAAAVLDGADGVTPDYLALIDPDSFTEVPDGFTGEAVLAVAAKVGPARLIDNVGVIVR